MRIIWCTSKSARDQPIFYLPKWLFWAAPFQCLKYLGYITLAKTSHTIPSIVWKSWQIFQGFFPTHWLQKVASTFRLGHCKYMKAFRGILLYNFVLNYCWLLKIFLTFRFQRKNAFTKIHSFFRNVYPFLDVSVFWDIYSVYL